MTTMGIKPGDAVLVIEHRGEQQLVYNALVASFSMDEELAGTHGEPAIEACFVGHVDQARYGIGLAALTITRVVHISHRDFVERHATLGYEELPGPMPGVCRYCRCTARRACPGGCAWFDPGQTVCTGPECLAKLAADDDALVRAIDCGRCE